MTQPAKPRPGFPARLTLGPKTNPQEKNIAARSPISASGGGIFQPSNGLGMDSVAVRAAMVSKLQAQGVRHEGVLRAMAEVERHGFVDSALANQAYEDTSLPIGLGQTISKPNVIARMMELLIHQRPLPLGRVLEIGTGCGYQAALLSRVCREVYTIERLKGLHEKARDLLRPYRIPNIHLLFGDGMLGFPSGAPYAGIIAAAGGDNIPQAWLEQLAVGGRIVAPASLGKMSQSLVIVDRTEHGFQQQVLEPVQFVPLKSGIG